MATKSENVSARFKDFIRADSGATLRSCCIRDRPIFSRPFADGDSYRTNLTEIIYSDIRFQTRHDWYQTESHVVVEILLKNQKADDVNVNFTSDTLSVTVKLLSGDYNLDLMLAHDIHPEKSSYKVLSSKIEIRLAKTQAVRWSSLVRKDGATAGVEPKMVGPNQISDMPRYPSSCTKAHDWDKLEKEIERMEKEEKPEGEQVRVRARIYQHTSVHSLP